MATWYVDLDASYTDNVANSGVATNLPLGGVAGIQRIVSGVAVGVNTFAAGETIKVRYSTGVNNRVVKLVKLTVAATTGTLVVGSTVTECANTDGTGAVTNVSGTIAWIQSATIVWIEDTGSVGWTASGTLYLFQSTGNYAGDITAVDKVGIGPNVAGTAVAGRCLLLGCDASWDELPKGTRIPINAAGCEYLFNSNTLEKAYWECRHITGSEPAYAVFRMYTQACLSDCSAYGAGMIGIWLSGNYSICEDCICSSNSQSGFNSQAYATFNRCVANSNSENGFIGSYVSNFIDCLAYDNTYSGISVSDQFSITIKGCVIDGNKRDGITLGTAHDVYIFGNRITNNSYDSATYYGINLSAANPTVFEDHNVFYNNSTNATPGTQHRLNVANGVNSLTATSVAEQGYTNVGGNIFTLTSAAIGRRMSVALPDALNTVYVTAGLTPPAPANSIVDANGVVTAGAGILNGSGVRAAAPGILDVTEGCYGYGILEDSTGIYQAFGIIDNAGIGYGTGGVLTIAGVYHDEGVLENSGADYYTLASEDSAPYLSGVGDGETAQHATDAGFLETNKDEIITADTDILGEFGVTGTAPAGGGVSLIGDGGLIG